MKTTIKNRRDQKMVVYVHEPEDESKGLAFVHHGFSGFADQPHVVVMTQAFIDHGYVTVVFDGTNSFGDSDGELIDCTMDTHYHDLEDVIAWVATQDWYQEPFMLAGHSLGGFSNLIYATNYPEKVSAMAPTSAVISYDLFDQAHRERDPKGWREFQETKVKIKTSKSKPEMVGRVPFDLYESFKNYDVMGQVDKITFPTLLVVGQHDDLNPAEHQQFLFEHLNCEKEIHVIKNCGHTFRAPEHLAELRQIFDQWIEKL